MAVSHTAVVSVDGEGPTGCRVRASPCPRNSAAPRPATNPEQLLAAGRAACFLGALRRAATGRRIRFTRTAVTAETTLTHGNNVEFSLPAVFNPVLGGVDQATARELADSARNEGRDWPTGTQAWSWAESAALSGHGPSATDFH